MSDVTINDAVGANKLLPEENFDGPDVSEEPERRGMDLGFLKSPTGPGSIESYIDHPMNFNKSKSLAQIIRGMTGFLGALDLAIIDVVMGLLSFTRERKAGSNANPV